MRSRWPRASSDDDLPADPRFAAAVTDWRRSPDHRQRATVAACMVG
jgi:hypothetical protein